MKFIAHRVNTSAGLSSLPAEYGAEIDIRDLGDRLILQHDPYIDGEDLQKYLSAYSHGTLILNIKSERIEHRVLDMVHEQGIKDYFLLDCSFPMIYALSNAGERNIAVRFSEFESIETVRRLEGRIKWVWVDCFSTLPLTHEHYEDLKGLGFSICLVSPELQGREGDITSYKKQLQNEGIELDAVCTKLKNIPHWLQA